MSPLSKAPAWVQRWGPTVALIVSLILILSWLDSKLFEPMRTQLGGLSQSVTGLKTEVAALKVQVSYIRNNDMAVVSEQVGEVGDAAVATGVQARAAADRNLATSRAIEAKLDSVLAGKKRPVRWSWP